MLADPLSCLPKKQLYMSKSNIHKGASSVAMPISHNSRPHFHHRPDRSCVHTYLWFTLNMPQSGSNTQPSQSSEVTEDTYKGPAIKTDGNTLDPNGFDEWTKAGFASHISSRQSQMSKQIKAARGLSAEFDHASFLTDMIAKKLEDAEAQIKHHMKSINEEAKSATEVEKSMSAICIELFEADRWISKKAPSFARMELAISQDRSLDAEPWKSSLPEGTAKV